MKAKEFIYNIKDHFEGLLYYGFIKDDEITLPEIKSGLDDEEHEALIMRLYYISIDPDKSIKYFINQYDDDKFLYFLKIEEGLWLFILSSDLSFAKLHFYIQFLLIETQLDFDDSDQSLARNEKFDSAKRIQEMLLPDLNLLENRFEHLNYHFRPMDSVGGDFYWTATEQDVTWIVVGDCTGHSMEGALASVSIMSILNQVYESAISPHMLIKNMHKSLGDIQHQRPTEGYGIGCEMMALRFDHANDTLTYSATGLPLHYINENGTYKYFKTKSASLDEESDQIFEVKNTQIFKRY